jgi:hypothetical protein
MITEMLAAGCVLFLVTLLTLAGLLSLRAAIRDQKPSPPVLWGEDE